ncbi:lasso peptide biosynthesis B2 protein [Cyanobium sp. ATX 6A2]|uniref:lasso peptide biosynthesis B2 protein n=1 Tax=Cyanobium sp. ATX 6A2 TaxID=2823700 RepID=UPI0020CB7306|nr:lasso peptide biosynthesis B2 protein [Cyanobium sp. ATX 6A2]MCP9888686.1 lasso peptide biosynthesis B2 protein [Cyanobium sp. ATX 6A2]
MISSWRRKARRFRALDADSRRVVLGSVLLLPVFWVRVKLLGRWELSCRNGAAIDAASAGSPASLEALRHLGKLVNAAAHTLLPPDNCLTRSLVLQWLLNRRGVPTDLRLGVQLINGQLQAHAWIESHGHPLNDGADVAERFLPLERVEPVERASADQIIVPA